MVRVKPAGMDTDMGQQRKGAETRLEGINCLSQQVLGLVPRDQYNM